MFDYLINQMQTATAAMEELKAEYQKMVEYANTLEYANKYLEKKNAKLQAKLAKCEKKLKKNKSDNIRFVVKPDKPMDIDELTITPDSEYERVNISNQIDMAFYNNFIKKPYVAEDEKSETFSELEQQVFDNDNIKMNAFEQAFHKNVVQATGEEEEVIEEEVVEEEIIEEEVVEEEVVEEEEVVLEEEVIEEEEEVVEEEVVEEEVVEEEVVEEEVVEEEVVEEEVIEEEVVEEVVEEEVIEEVVQEEEEDQDVYEVEINGNSYYVTNEVNSIIYAADDEGEITIEAGKYVNGKPVFN